MRESFQMLRELHAGEGAIWRLAWVGDSQVLIAGTEAGHLRAWDLASRKNWQVDSQTWVISLVFASNDGRIFVTRSSQEKFEIWDSRLSSHKSIPAEGSREIYEISFSPIEQEAVTAECSNRISVWDIKAGKRKHVIEGHTGFVASVSYSRGPRSSHAQPENANPHRTRRSK